MKPNEDITNIINSLTYISLLPKPELFIEIFKIIQHIKILIMIKGLVVIIKNY